MSLYPGQYLSPYPHKSHTLLSIPPQPLQNAFFAKDVVAPHSDWAPQNPLAYRADQIVAWTVHEVLHVVTTAL